MQKSISQKPVASIRRGRPPKGLSSAAVVRYAQIRAKYPNITAEDAKNMAGYAERSHPPRLDAALATSIERQRDAAIQATGYTITRAMDILVSQIADSPDEHAADRIRAIHEANLMLPGYHAPQQVSVNTKSLFIELRDISTQQLNELASLNSLSD